MAGHQLVTLYTVWGRALDLDTLLKRAAPSGRYRTWRRGEDTEYGGRGANSGLSMIVAGGASSRAHCNTIVRFLHREARFLQAVRRIVGPGVDSELSTTLFVDYPPPAGVQTQKLSLPATLLRLAASRGVRWSMAVQQEAVEPTA